MVVKHEAHRRGVDRPGKDSERLFRSGADMLLQSPHEEFVRRNRAQENDLFAVLVSLVDRYDLVLVEGDPTQTITDTRRSVRPLPAYDFAPRRGSNPVSRS